MRILKKGKPKFQVDMQKVSDELIRYRTENQMSINELGRILGINIGTLSRWENKKWKNLHRKSYEALLKFGLNI